LAFPPKTCQGVQIVVRPYQHVQRDEDVPPEDHWILSLYVDHAGILWIGAYGALLTKVDLASVVFTRYAQTVAFESHPDGPGGIHWVGTREGIHRLDRSTGKMIPVYSIARDARGPDPDYIISAYEDRSGTLWVATDPPLNHPLDVGGLYRLNQDGSFTRFPRDPDASKILGHAVVRIIHEDRAGNLWLAVCRRSPLCGCCTDMAPFNGVPMRL
jgi:ligand-binding sensor domain-containing protein